MIKSEFSVEKARRSMCGRLQSVEKPHSVSHPIETGGVYADKGRKPKGFRVVCGFHARKFGEFQWKPVRVAVAGELASIAANLRKTGMFRDPRAALPAGAEPREESFVWG